MFTVCFSNDSCPVVGNLHLHYELNTSNGLVISQNWLRAGNNYGWKSLRLCPLHRATEVQRLLLYLMQLNREWIKSYPADLRPYHQYASCPVFGYFLAKRATDRLKLLFTDAKIETNITIHFYEQLFVHYTSLWFRDQVSNFSNQLNDFRNNRIVFLDTSVWIWV